LNFDVYTLNQTGKWSTESTIIITSCYLETYRDEKVKNIDTKHSNKRNNQNSKSKDKTIT